MGHVHAGEQACAFGLFFGHLVVPERKICQNTHKRTLILQGELNPSLQLISIKTPSNPSIAAWDMMAKDP